jgi:hypothetical protein
MWPITWLAVTVAEAKRTEVEAVNPILYIFQPYNFASICSDDGWYEVVGPWWGSGNLQGEVDATSNPEQEFMTEAVKY